MKICIVGSSGKYAIERHYISGLKSQNIDCVLIGVQQHFLEYYHKSIFNKIQYRLGLSGILKRGNKIVSEQIRKFEPDVIWVFKGMEILPKTLKQWRKAGYTLVCYNPDHPFVFSGLGSGNSNVTESINIYNHHFTYSPEIRERLHQNGQKSVSMLPFGFDSLAIQNRKEIKGRKHDRLCFIGNADRFRKEKVLKLCAAGVKIDVYGIGWDTSHELLKIEGPVYDDDYWTTAAKYLIHLNVFRPHNIRSHNMRTFEIPAIGSVLISPYTKQQTEFFESEKEMFFYESDDDLVQTCKKVLQLDSKALIEVGNSARQKSLSADYSYLSLSKKVITLLKSKFNL